MSRHALARTRCGGQHAKISEEQRDVPDSLRHARNVEERCSEHGAWWCVVEHGGV